jgi:hypothetical protein
MVLEIQSIYATHYQRLCRKFFTADLRYERYKEDLPLISTDTTDLNLLRLSPDQFIESI